MKYTINDRITCETHTTEGRQELADVLSELFDVTEPGVSEAIDRIACGIGIDYIGADEEFLNISIDIDPDDGAEEA